LYNILPTLYPRYEESHGVGGWRICLSWAPETKLSKSLRRLSGGRMREKMGLTECFRFQPIPNTPHWPSHHEHDIIRPATVCVSSLLPDNNELRDFASPEAPGTLPGVTQGLGFFGCGTHTRVRVPTCPTAVSTINLALRKLTSIWQQGTAETLPFRHLDGAEDSRMDPPRLGTAPLAAA